MDELGQMLRALGDKNGLEISLDENGACALELADGRMMLLQERAGLNELDFVATLGTVPEEVRADVFTDLLSANFYWKETLGATISWNDDLGEVVLMYPFPLGDATSALLDAVFTRFVELQSAWGKRLSGMIAAAQGRESGEDDEGEEDESAGSGGVIINP